MDKFLKREREREKKQHSTPNHQFINHNKIATLLDAVVDDLGGGECDQDKMRERINLLFGVSNPHFLVGI